MYALIILFVVLMVIGHATSGKLKTQNGQVEDIALSTLAARTAILADGDFNGITATFLIKRIRYFLELTGVTANEGPFIIVLAPGNASIPEITDALTKRNTAGPDDVTQVLTEDSVWAGAFQDSVEFMRPPSGGTESTVWVTSGDWHVLGGGKGLPAVEGGGWTLNIFNADNGALTTGAILKGTYQLQGVWLGS